MEFTFQPKTKNILLGLTVVGLVLTIVGFVTDHTDHHARSWTNVLISGFYFFGMALAATFFIALNYAAQAGWATVVKRVFEAVSAYLPVGSLILVIFFLAGTFHMHHVYHWMDAEVHDPNSEHYDALIAGKGAYLNNAFFWVRALLYLFIWNYCRHLFRKRSLEEDMNGGLSYHKKNITLSVLFIAFFAVTSSTSSWDWLMSIDTHWFSTLFGWYTFSGIWISGTVAVTLFVLYLKSKGHLKEVNDNHLHDLGKWIFAISFLWSYLWFSQFMLIWYSDIPEEVTYYVTRFDDYRGLFLGMMAVNLVFPMLLLMSRDAKRKPYMLWFVGLILIVTHWLDIYIMTMPGAVGEEYGFGLPEIGMFVFTGSLFVFTVLRAVSKAPLITKNHPYLEESIHLHT